MTHPAPSGAAHLGRLLRHQAIDADTRHHTNTTAISVQEL